MDAFTVAEVAYNNGYEEGYKKAWGDSAYTRHCFDSCSYEELTSCVHSRVKWLKEYKRFSDSTDMLERFPLISASTRLSAALRKYEIKRILHIRRILKCEGIKHLYERVAPTPIEH